MNSYPGFNSNIINLINKYATSLCCQFEGKIDIEDFQQDLMISVIRSLEKFDPRHGLIEQFINKCLYNKALELSRNIKKQKRKTFLFFCELRFLPAYSGNQSPHAIVESSNLLAYLPKGLREYIQNPKPNKKTDYSKNQIIKKILSKAICNKGVRSQMKNISCIETLSVQELTRLSETDLHDLSEKISQTYSWIKQLSEKFDLVLSSKYTEEAKKKLYESGIDFGICKLKRNGFVVNVTLPKKVQWNQTELEKVYNSIDPELRKNIFKVTFSIDEKQYAKLDKNMTDAISPARSTSYGKVKISINKAQGINL